jgi:hypothetical protein
MQEHHIVSHGRKLRKCIHRSSFTNAQREYSEKLSTQYGGDGLDISMGMSDPQN